MAAISAHSPRTGTIEAFAKATQTGAEVASKSLSTVSCFESGGVGAGVGVGGRGEAPGLGVGVGAGVGGGAMLT